MGYVRKEIQLLGGGFNIYPPADKVPITDYLLAQNWRVDRYGKLVSRWGYPLKFTIPGATFAHSGACAGGVEGDYYIAANTGSGSNPCAVYFDPDHTSIVVVSGLSGQRVGMIEMNGWMWIMDTSVQGRYSPSPGPGYHAWGIAPPTSGQEASFAAAAGSADPTGPNGTYTFYATYETSDQSYETNPGPITPSVTVALQDVNFTGIPVSTDPLMTGGTVNIYAIGGTLEEAYLVTSVANGTTTGVWNTNDLFVTDNGQILAITHDAPPAGAGLVGPYFSRLYTWVGNRLYYTPPGQPQYWNTDPTLGDWVDVGQDGENIMWCTAHPGVLLIYKERSIWYLAGDPTTGTLQGMEDGSGLVSAFAVVAAGAFDYFVAPGSLRRCNPNLGRTEDISENLRPLFTTQSINSGPLTPPGNIIPGPLQGVTSLDCYAIALGYAMGKLYVSYGENATSGTAAVTLIYSEVDKRWLYHRNGMSLDRFHGFLFDGIMMQGLSGTTSGSAEATGHNLDDFRVWYTQDEKSSMASSNIECVYQSHFEDVGMPDNDKCWLEVVVDYVLNSGNTATVYAYYNVAGSPSVTLGTITGTGTRKQTSFTLGTDGTLARNISISIDCVASAQVELHNVYLYYYLEARLALSAATIPVDLGSAAVKQCKELMLDVDSSLGAVDVNLYSDLPGNALTVRQTPVVAAGTGRAILKFPFAVTEGFLWRIALTAATSGRFRLYGARLLMRPVGIYVEAYESAAGFVWDSMQLSFESGITHITRAFAIALTATPIKRYREISFEIETFNSNVTLTFLTDLPGNAMASRMTFTINTGTAGRRFVRLPLPAGTNAPIEGRLCQLQTSGSSKYIIYDAAVEVLAVGIYIEAYEAAGGAVYDSRETDFGSVKAKECREIELDIETTGVITATLYSDLPSPYQMASIFTNAAVSTTGRQKIMLPLTTSTAPFVWPLGRLFRLILTGSNAFRLYGAKVKLREVGTYLTGDEASATPAGVWDSTPLDLGTERFKDFKKLEFEIQTDAACTLILYTDQNGAIAQQFTTTINTGGLRETVKIPLTPGIRGRLVQVEIAGAGVRIFAGRIWWRAMNEPKAVWAWAPLPVEPTPPQWSWQAFPVAATGDGNPAQWFWAKVLSVTETPAEWTWIDVPFEVSG